MLHDLSLLNLPAVTLQLLRWQINLPCCRVRIHVHRSKRPHGSHLPLQLTLFLIFWCYFFKVLQFWRCKQCASSLNCQGRASVRTLLLWFHKKYGCSCPSFLLQKTIQALLPGGGNNTVEVFEDSYSSLHSCRQAKALPTYSEGLRNGWVWSPLWNLVDSRVQY